MSNINKQALREELSNPAIGSNANLRKLALALLDELETKEEQRTNWFQMAQKLGEDLDASEKRIAELEARTLSQAATDVLAERRRQITAEGWTPEHDDKYRHSEMLWAACCYVLNTIQKYNRVPFDWPWRDEWWKPTNQRRDLVKANALLLAEIERIDRAADAGKGE